MKIDIDTVSPVERRIRAEVPVEADDEELSRVYGGLSQRTRVKGFRPGKVPRSVLQGLYGDAVRGEVLSHLVEHSLRDVFRERGLKVVSRPQVETEPLEEGRAFAFSAVVQVKPEIEVQNYLGVEVEKVKLSVDDGQVELGLRRLQDAYARLEPVEDRDRVEQGDFILIDFDGSIEGKPFAGGKRQNTHIEVGRGQTLPQFEEALVGLKKGSEHTMSVAYPQDFSNQELAGRTAAFRVVVREIKKKILPALDDEFAKDHGECATLEELREKIRNRLESELIEIQARELKEQLLARLIEGHRFEVPQALVEQQVRYLKERHLARREAEALPLTEEMRKEIEAQALRQVQGTLLIEKIAAVENIQVTDEELRQEIDRLARSAGERGAALRELYRREDASESLRSEMIFERALGWLLQRAKVKEVQPPA
jgi:trigger factor